MKRLVFGVIIILVGVVLLLYNMNVIPAQVENVLISWPMLLITLGLINISERRSWLQGAILLAIGVFFILPRIYWFPFNFQQLFWPVLLIAAGVLILIKRSRFHSHWHYRHHRHQHSEFTIEDGFIKDSNVFGGNKKTISPMVFKGGKIVNIFGGSEIDLTQTTLAEGTNVLEISCVFGGVVIIVPAHWNVQSEVTAILGGFQDKRRFFDKAPEESSCKLIVKGEAILGGGEIKRV